MDRLLVAANAPFDTTNVVVKERSAAKSAMLVGTATGVAALVLVSLLRGPDSMHTSIQKCVLPPFNMQRNMSLLSGNV